MLKRGWTYLLVWGLAEKWGPGNVDGCERGLVGGLVGKWGPGNVDGWERGLVGD